MYVSLTQKEIGQMENQREYLVPLTQREMTAINCSLELTASVMEMANQGDGELGEEIAGHIKMKFELAKFPETVRQ
jgi:hypothetical protein